MFSQPAMGSYQTWRAFSMPGLCAVDEITSLVDRTFTQVVR
jgi:hypothetical protein